MLTEPPPRAFQVRLDRLGVPGHRRPLGDDGQALEDDRGGERVAWEDLREVVEVDGLLLLRRFEGTEIAIPLFPAPARASIRSRIETLHGATAAGAVSREQALADHGRLAAIVGRSKPEP